MAEMCKIHIDKEVIGTCLNCGKGVCAVCVTTIEDKTYCNDCTKILNLDAQDKKEVVAWENKAQIGFWKALIKTWFNVIFHPKKFFSNMPTTGGLKTPLLFGIIWGSLGVIIGGVLNLILQTKGIITPPPGVEAPSKNILMASYPIVVVMGPILVVLGLFIAAGVYHVSVLIFGGRKGFQPTLRVVCYTNALSVFNLIPIVGPIFVTAYSVVLFCLGFKRAHQITTIKAVFAALLPIILLFIVGFTGAFGRGLSTISQEGFRPPVISQPTP